MKTYVSQVNFNGGEVSLAASVRVDMGLRAKSVGTMTNWIPLPQGGVTKDPGSQILKVTSVSTIASGGPRLVPFVFSQGQSYLLEMGGGLIFFYRNGARIQSSPGVDYFKSIAWTDSQIWEADYVQKADALYLVHPSKAPLKLLRLADTNWTLTNPDWQDGPYLPVNMDVTTLTPLGTTGTVTVNASSTAGINGGAGFLATDVGRSLRIKCGGAWVWGKITTVWTTTQIVWEIAAPVGILIPRTATATANISSGSVFSITVTDGGNGYGATPPSVSISGGGGSGAVAYAVLTDGAVTSIVVSTTGTGYGSAPTVTIAAPTPLVASSTPFWRLGLWGETTGYPGAATLHQDRLGFGGTPVAPARMDLSVSGEYETFRPTNVDGTVVASNAISVTLDSAADAIKWAASDEWGLLLGTTGGEYIIAPSTGQQALAANQILVAKPLGNYGSYGVKPIRVGKSLLFVQRDRRGLREMNYQFAYQTFRSPDIALAANHFTRGGIRQMAFQFAPIPTLWGVNSDGTLFGVSYNAEQETLGWHRHTSDGAHFGSVAVIPSLDGLGDDLYRSVRRFNASNGTYIWMTERVERVWQTGDNRLAKCYLDSYTACFKGSGSITDKVAFGLPVEFVGMTLACVVDGATHPDVTVFLHGSGTGAVTLQRTGDTAFIGHNRASVLKLLPPDTGSQDGQHGLGKVRQVPLVDVLVQDTDQLSVTSTDPVHNADGDYPLPWRDGNDLMDNPVLLFTGWVSYSYECKWDKDTAVEIVHDTPTPATILMIAYRAITEGNS